MKFDQETGEVILSVEGDSLKDICHYGKGHKDGGHSGRYPWGSGDDRFQRPDDFYTYVKNLESKGLSEKDIATGLGYTTTELRAYNSMAMATRKKAIIKRAKDLSKLDKDEEGNPMTNTRIGIILGKEFEDGTPIGESTVRNYLNEEKNSQLNAAANTAEFLMKQVDEKGMIDVGVIVNKELGVSQEKMRQALYIAEAEGYEVLYGSVEQQGHPGQRTNLVALAPKGTPKNAIYDYKNIHHITEYTSNDNGKSFRKYEYPSSVNPNRVKIRYAEEGGLEKDGVIEIRRGVKDLSLGNSNYAQVRILVDNGGGDKDRYIKGMAVYSDGKDMPDGIDILVNSNKPKGTDKLDCLKKVKENLEKDPENPFGSNIKEGGQSYYDDPNGKYVDPITGNKQSLSLINKRADEGDWKEWSKETASQMLSKQPKGTISKQLNRSILDRQAEYDEIMKINNPTVKAKLLMDFANDCDASAVELKAAQFPGARYHVILPSTTLKDNEVYAPNFADGTQVALVRYPHGGTFEIPILTVNNKNKEALEMIGPQSNDAIAITYNVAKRLSGADFDGDTVLTIPTNTNGIDIKSTRALEGLKDFDTGLYGPDAVGGIVEDVNGEKHYFRNGIEFKHANEAFKQKQMGVVSNLITDMSLQGASEEELARAVRHSMVVIDSVKHHLDYKSSEIENNVEELKEKYQKNLTNKKGYGGASTLISKAGSVVNINKRAEGQFILNQPGNPDNGNVLEVLNVDRNTYIDKSTGKVYSSKDKKTLYFNEKTGEKLYHDTNEAYTKVEYRDDEGKKIQTPAYIKVDNTYRRPRSANLEDETLYYRDSTGEFKKVTSRQTVLTKRLIQEETRMSLVKDAKELSSGTIQEEYYADYANKLKQMANDARKDWLYYSSHPIPYSPEAKKEYEEEWKSLNRKISQAELNAPKERAANMLAASIVKEKIEASDRTYTKEEEQKLRNNELVKARLKYGAHNMRFSITEREWEAVQKGAFSKNVLEKILRYADQDIVRQLATPKEEVKLTESQIRRIKGLAAQGETNAAIAKRLGISSSTVSEYLK